MIIINRPCIHSLHAMMSHKPNDVVCDDMSVDFCSRFYDSHFTLASLNIQYISSSM